MKRSAPKKAKKNILEIEQKNCKHYNLRRKKFRKYNLGDLVAIKRTQQVPALKLKSEFLDPYKVTKVTLTTPTTRRTLRNSHQLRDYFVCLIYKTLA